MGGRDYRHRETKKPKKTNKITRSETVMPSADVSVVRKKKPRQEEE